MLQVDSNPFSQFHLWFEEACTTMPAKLVNTMTLATVSADYKPSARIVLLKEYDENGFVFYTNYNSHKGRDIQQNPSVALLFWWEALERQVRIEGIVEKLSESCSQNYFVQRPKSSQIAASISQQSEQLISIDELQKNYEALFAQYSDAEKLVPRPPNWGGYIVNPTAFEYWQGRENRLHDRFKYFLLSSGQWKITRLFP